MTRLQKELMNLMSTSQDIEVTEVKYNEIPKQTWVQADNKYFSWTRKVYLIIILLLLLFKIASYALAVQVKDSWSSAYREGVYEKEVKKRVIYSQLYHTKKNRNK